MLRKNGGRALAYIVTVDKVEPIEGYDRIELATVGGWRCVVARGMAAGDKAVYFEIDSLLPRDDKRFAFCEKYKWRVKTQRMCRGTVLSQGLLMPLWDFPELARCKVGDDVTAKLRVKHCDYEESDSRVKRGRFSLRRRPQWPAWVKKTDEERIQNCAWMLEPDDFWVATEKIDGMSTTFTMRRGLFGRKKMTVCSRNIVVKDGVWMEVAENYHVRDVLEELLDERPSARWVTIQGETYGRGVQKRDYGLNVRHFAAFNLIYSDVGRLGTIPMTNVLTQKGIPCVPLIGQRWPLPKTVDEVLELADGVSRIDGGPREGLVFRSPDGARSFKAVSNKYLLEKSKKKGGARDAEGLSDT